MQTPEATVVSVPEQLRALRSDAGVCVLDERVVLVRGQDRLSWLAGMVTQDVKKLAQGEGAYTAVVHEKGKLLAHGFVQHRGETLALVLPSGTCTAVLEHFERHIIMEDAEVALADERVVTVQGPEAAARVTARGLAGFAANRLTLGGVDLCAREAELPALLERLEQAGLVRVGREAWERVRLEQGVPAWGVDFGPENYVQEAGLTRRAVSFNKGCYCGQEVVCRLEMRGHVRRQLLVVRGQGGAPATGAALDGDAGVVTSASAQDDGAFVALAMAKWDVVSEPARAVSLGGGALERLPSRWMEP